MGKFSIPALFVCLFALTGAVPYLESADKVHVQMLYLSIINIISVYYLYNRYSNNFGSQIGKYLRKTPIFIFFIFFIWTIITIIPAINFQESLIQLTFYFQQFLSFLLILLFLDTQKYNIDSFFKVIIVFLCLIEIIPPLVPYFSDIIEFGKPSFRSLEYRGITGSLNILAFSLLIKLPFIFYYSFTARKNKILYVVITFIAMFVIFSITKTRGAFIYILFIYPLLVLFFSFYDYKKLKINLIKSSIKPILIIIVPIIIAVFITNYIESNSIDEGSKVQDRVSTLMSEDSSTSQRLRYYQGAIESIVENPFFGIGTGNWEIVGTKKDWKGMQGYTVPYHAHNDYLEITAESGLLGGLLYFFVIFYVVFKILKKFFIKVKKNENFLIDLILLTSISAYLFDALINFPSARPIQQINLFLILSYSILYLKEDIGEFKIRHYRPIIVFIICLLPLSLYSSLRIYQSSVQQKIILYLYNSGQTDIDKGFLDNIEIDYPSLATTSVPLKAFKAYFYLKNNYFDESIELFNEASRYNPYVYFSEGWKSMAFYQLGQMDSARYSAQIAYNKIPNNVIHYGHLLQAMVAQKDSVSLKNLYDNHKYKSQIEDELYYTGIAAILDKDSEGFVLDDFDIIEQSGSKYVKKGMYTLKVGYDNMINAAKYHTLGEYAFESKQFTAALENFQKAVDLNPYEIPYKENLANSFLQLDQNNEVIDIINDIENDNQLTNKARWIRALALISINDNQNACNDLSVLLQESYIPQNLYSSLCLNKVD